MLGQITNNLFHLVGIGRNIVASNTDSALGRFYVASNGLHCGGLAGTVRPQKAQNLSRLDLKRQIIDGPLRAIKLGKILNNYIQNSTI